jgi:hypothetical protein
MARFFDQTRVVVISGVVIAVLAIGAALFALRPAIRLAIWHLLSPEEKTIVTSDGRPPRKVDFPEIEDWSSLRIGLSRSVCMGTCPAYQVELSGDGSVRYLGGAFVAVGGEHRWTVSRDAVRALFQQFKDAEIFWSYDKYQAHITDNPTYRLSIAFDGHEKTLNDYVGPSVGMPEVFTALEDAVDKAVATEKWLKLTNETVPALIAEGYFRKPETDTSILATMIGTGASRDVIADLIARGATVNAKGRAFYALWTPLMTAAYTGKPDIAILLLDHGADVDVAGENGETALMWAAWSAQADIVARLLAAGANVSAQDNHDESALALATRSEAAHQSAMDKVIGLLLHAKAGVNLCDQERNTPLSNAAGNGSVATVRMLLVAGANPNLSCGISPLLNAKDAATVTLLLDGGADPRTIWDGSKTVYNAICNPHFATDERCEALKTWLAAHPKVKSH